MFSKLVLASLLTVTMALPKTALSMVGVEMKNSANQIISTFTKSQSEMALHDFNSPKKKSWTFLPVAKLGKVFPKHAGISMRDLNATQKALVMKLVESGLSESGNDLVKSAMAADSDRSIVRRLLDTTLFYYSQDNYFISFFGNPNDQKWMWRFEGHHLSININLENNQVVSNSPLFLGVNPSEYTLNGRPVVLHDKTKSEIKDLLKNLDNAQLEIASKSIDKVPASLLFAAPTNFGKDQTPASLEAMPKGLSVASLRPEQQQSVLRVVESYLNNLNSNTNTSALKLLKSQDLAKMQVVFVGDTTLVQDVFYLRIQVSNFVFEIASQEKALDHHHASFVTF